MQVIHMPLTKAQNNFSEALREIEQGKQVIFTRRGKAVGVLQPFSEKAFNGKKISKQLKNYAVKVGTQKVDMTKTIKTQRDNY
ncbi:MAG: type II toxin-antitoxin system prevent-host-death family antitoxin [bacterium]